MHPWRQSVSSWPWAVSLLKGELNSFLHGCHHLSSLASTDLVPLVLSFQLTQCSSGMHPPCNWEFNAHLRTTPHVCQALCHIPGPHFTPPQDTHKPTVLLGLWRASLSEMSLLELCCELLSTHIKGKPRKEALYKLLLFG